MLLLLNIMFGLKGLFMDDMFMFGIIMLGWSDIKVYRDVKR